VDAAVDHAHAAFAEPSLDFVATVDRRAQVRVEAHPRHLAAGDLRVRVRDAPRRNSDYFEPHQLFGRLRWRERDLSGFSSLADGSPTRTTGGRGRGGGGRLLFGSVIAKSSSSGDVASTHSV